MTPSARPPLAGEPPAPPRRWGSVRSGGGVISLPLQRGGGPGWGSNNVETIKIEYEDKEHTKYGTVGPRGVGRLRHRERHPLPGGQRADNGHRRGGTAGGRGRDGRQGGHRQRGPHRHALRQRLGGRQRAARHAPRPQPHRRRAAGRLRPVRQPGAVPLRPFRLAGQRARLGEHAGGFLQPGDLHPAQVRACASTRTIRGR